MADKSAQDDVNRQSLEGSKSVGEGGQKDWSGDRARKDCSQQATMVRKTVVWRWRSKGLKSVGDGGQQDRSLETEVGRTVVGRQRWLERLFFHLCFSSLSPLSPKVPDSLFRAAIPVFPIVNPQRKGEGHSHPLQAKYGSAETANQLEDDNRVVFPDVRADLGNEIR
ncbi:hypothetical protein IEQ34_008925 [Dendrobium chrysotoxum]|uniref:Uncharacterized protein n=1 Tax=Dendrobium chrysotoxum TaxID=161865 RepID=A0AAV7GZ63_DENCH|nr:hypothetical protein IEQ34_008925 [Dendrobium chrysotoxum]